MEIGRVRFDLSQGMGPNYLKMGKSAILMEIKQKEMKFWEWADGGNEQWPKPKLNLRELAEKKEAKWSMAHFCWF